MNKTEFEKFRDEYLINAARQAGMSIHDFIEYMGTSIIDYDKLILDLYIKSKLRIAKA